jgi:acyl CoA:acetate/3-ketoacid CoA transferase beta subunit
MTADPTSLGGNERSETGDPGDPTSLGGNERSETGDPGSVTRAEHCVVACADAWRGDGEIFASPMGPIPSLGARLARATFEPDLLLSDGEASFVAGTWGLDDPAPDTVEAWVPFRTVFDLLWLGRRHVMMSPVQIDRYGNVNISCIGPDFAQPKVQLLGVRGAPGNTVSHATSYWVASHDPRTFVAHVDMVSGVGYDRAAAAGPTASEHLDLRRVVSPLGVFDFGGEGHRMRLVAVHPGVSVDEVAERTGFELAVTDEVPTSRAPTAEELQLLRTVLDPNGRRDREVRA